MILQIFFLLFLVFISLYLKEKYALRNVPNIGIEYFVIIIWNLLYKKIPLYILALKYHIHFKQRGFKLFGKISSSDLLSLL